MSSEKAVNYGPLTKLIGAWQGDKGSDVSPLPEGTENNDYREVLTFVAAGDVTNAEQQTLSMVRYTQVVHRKSTGEKIHDETGYWLWDAASNELIHALVIPRGVSIVAGGRFIGDAGATQVTLSVAASQDDMNWPIAQAPFMRDRARTLSFNQSLIVTEGKLIYTQSIWLDIYGRRFEHTDSNELTKG